MCAVVHVDAVAACLDMLLLFTCIILIKDVFTNSYSCLLQTPYIKAGDGSWKMFVFAY